MNHGKIKIPKRGQKMPIFNNNTSSNVASQMLSLECGRDEDEGSARNFLFRFFGPTPKLNRDSLALTLTTDHLGSRSRRPD